MSGDEEDEDAGHCALDRKTEVAKGATDIISTARTFDGRDRKYSYP